MEIKRTAIILQRFAGKREQNCHMEHFYVRVTGNNQEIRVQHFLQDSIMTSFCLYSYISL